jgi:hypothetical protein
MFKLALPALVNALGMKICIAHSPPYTAKANPLEPRLCPHGSTMCQRALLEPVHLVKAWLAKVTTRTGLKSIMTRLAKVYQSGRKVAAGCQANLQLVCGQRLPQWHDTAKPA